MRSYPINRHPRETIVPADVGAWLVLGCARRKRRVLMAVSVMTGVERIGLGALVRQRHGRRLQEVKHHKTLARLTH